jgi:hypothetical protein
MYEIYTHTERKYFGNWTKVNKSLGLTCECGCQRAEPCYCVKLPADSIWEKALLEVLLSLTLMLLA